MRKQSHLANQIIKMSGCLHVYLFKNSTVFGDTVQPLVVIPAALKRIHLQCGRIFPRRIWFRIQVSSSLQ